MRIYKNTTVFSLSLLLSVIGFSKTIDITEQNNFKKKFRIEIKLSCGMDYLSIGDWNKYMQSNTKLNRDLAHLFNYNIGGEFEKIHLGLDFEGEIVFFFTPRIGISIGSGYIHGMKGKDSSKIVTHLTDVNYFCTPH